MLMNNFGEFLLQNEPLILLILELLKLVEKRVIIVSQAERTVGGCLLFLGFEDISMFSLDSFFDAVFYNIMEGKKNKGQY